MNMTMKTMWPLAICASLALGACTPPDADDPDQSSTPDEETEGLTDGVAPPTTATSGQSDTEDSAEETADEEESSGGCSFIGCNDVPPPPQCSLFAQDCPDGEKCMPWANDGGDAWNATICVPVDDSPGQPGDECAVEGSGVSGVDDCDLGSMCWDVDPETNVGTCVPMCTGDASAPICENPDTSCTIANEGNIVLCLPVCDPLLQDCAEGQACYPIADQWNCAPDASGEMGSSGDPCEYINACDAGNICLGAAAWPGCVGSAGCCSPVCDVEDPQGDAQCPGDGQTCQVWYEEGASPPGYEAVGACALPG